MGRGIPLFEGSVEFLGRLTAVMSKALPKSGGALSFDGDSNDRL
jgi:hypothetical protein